MKYLKLAESCEYINLMLAFYNISTCIVYLFVIVMFIICLQTYFKAQIKIRLVKKLLMAIKMP